MTRLLTDSAIESTTALCDPPGDEMSAARPAAIGRLSAAVKSWFRKATSEAWDHWPHAAAKAPAPIARRSKAKRQRPLKNAPKPAPLALDIDWSILDRESPQEWLKLIYALAGAIASGTRLTSEEAERLGEFAARIGDAELGADPVRHQIACGEIPLLLAALAGDSPDADYWGDQARKGLTRGVVDLCDGEGMVEAKHLPIFWSLLAGWTRCYSLARAVGGSCFDREGETQLTGAVNSALRLLRSDGSPALSAKGGEELRPLVFAALAEMGSDAEQELAAKILPAAWIREADLKLPKKKPVKAKLKKKSEPAPAYPAAGTFSDWAHFAQLRTSSARNATRMTVAYDRAHLTTELESAGRTVWSGETHMRLVFQGEELTPTSEWEEVCWLEEDGADYLELSIDFAHGIELQRQILLDREAGMIYLADVVLSPASGDLELEVRWPLANSLALQGADETREAFLCEKKKPLATVVCPAFPEWQAAPASGSLQAAEGSLTLQMRNRGPNLYAPLVIDLHPRRAAKEVTWRKLTIAENLQPIDPKLAVGYRVRIGNRHWLFYRSLGPRGNRTVFGVNLITEFLASRIEKDGKTTTLVEVE